MFGLKCPGCGQQVDVSESGRGGDVQCPRCGQVLSRKPASQQFETVAAEKVNLIMATVGESRLELLEPTSEDSTIAKFLAKRGEGLHHVALQVPNLAALVEKLKQDGVRLVSEEIKIGAGGHRYVFVHPASAGGVLLELIEEPELLPSHSL